MEWSNDGARMITATGLLGGRPHFLHWGVIQISVANLLVIAIMLLTFLIALLVPFPATKRPAVPPTADPAGADSTTVDPVVRRGTYDGPR